MIKERIIQSLGIWILVSLLLLLIGEPLWDLPPLQAVLYAGLFGFSVFLTLGRQMSGGKDTVDEITSPDGIVQATVEAWDDKNTILYIAKVKRNYRDGVFAVEKEFEGVVEAKEWLASTYQQELEKHQQKLQAQQIDNN
ncbi:hypothetical protein [Candidatus Leptofilum sp.]|uniref:hypothetical protein n=1 Tax=Candidatus Leptofilum sp. TaxID=3241576 RepID=UPI003B59A5AF